MKAWIKKHISLHIESWAPDLKSQSKHSERFLFRYWMCHKSMQCHEGYILKDGSSQSVAPAVLMQNNLPLLSNTSQECQRLEPTQSQPASTPHSIDRDTSYQIFPDDITQTNKLETLQCIGFSYTFRTNCEWFQVCIACFAESSSWFQHHRHNMVDQMIHS